MALMGLDVGGTGAKATVFSDSGEIIASSYREYNMVSPNPGWYEYIPSVLRDAAITVMREAAEGSPEEIRGIGVSTFGESVVLRDENGNVLSNTMMYLDNRGIGDFNEYSEGMDVNAFRAVHGSPLLVNHTVIMLHVMNRTMPGIFQRTKRLDFIAGYILSDLGGGHAVDYSVGMTTGAMDVVNKCWDREAFLWAGLDPDLMPDLVPPGTCIGELNENGAKLLGMKVGVKLVLGGLDHIASSIGAAVTDKGQVMNAIGTVDGLFFVTDSIDPKDYKENYLFLPHVEKGLYGAMLANLAGGVLLKWFRDHIGRFEKDAWAKEGKDFYAEYEKQMAKTPTDLIVLPRFGGRGGRFSDKAGILNMTLSTTNEEIYRAFMEGETFEMYNMLGGYINEGHPVDSVVCVGGAARCDTYMQLRADIFGVPVYTVTCDQPGALGNAMMAGVAAGVFDDLNDAIASIVKRRKEFYPSAEAHEYYMGQYEKFLRIYRFLEDIEG